jgi:predicted hotdog family 3-hydroxylacyl-ACP dehydratase
MFSTKSNYPPISGLVPHTRNMALLERVIYRDANRIDCLMTISVQDPFTNEYGNVPAYVGIEYMSQGVAAHSSLNKTDKTERGKIGVLLGSRKVELFVQEFFQKQELLISANLVLKRDGFGVFDCDIRNADDGELLVRGCLKFYEPKTIDDMDAL